MNYLLFLVLLIIIIVSFYLVFHNNIPMIYISSSTKNDNLYNPGREEFLVGTTGISQICNSSIDPISYNDPKICFDISYNNIIVDMYFSWLQVPNRSRSIDILKKNLMSIRGRKRSDPNVRKTYITVYQ